MPWAAEVSGECVQRRKAGSGSVLPLRVGITAAQVFAVVPVPLPPSCLQHAFEDCRQLVIFDRAGIAIHAVAP